MHFFSVGFFRVAHDELSERGTIRSQHMYIISVMEVLMTTVKFNWIHYRMGQTTLLTMLLCCGIISGDMINNVNPVLLRSRVGGNNGLSVFINVGFQNLRHSKINI